MPGKSEIEAIAKGGKRRSPRLWAGLALLALAGAGAWYYTGSGNSTASVQYTTQKAANADIVVMVTATGTIEPVNEVAISSELSGTIRAVNADFNDEVKKGDILASLDTDKLEANVESASATVAAREAGLAEAQATAQQAKDTLDRAQELLRRGISSQENLLSARAASLRASAAVATATAMVRVAQADLKLQQTNLEKACICSPIDGIVLNRAVEVGQIVASSLSAPTLFTLAESLTSMQLTVDIDEADIGKVVIGNEANFTVEAWQNRSFSAAITHLRFAPKTVEGVVTYEAILDVDNSDLSLRPGMTATAEITVEELNGVLAVPNAALRFAPPATAEKTSGGTGLLGMLFRRPPSNDAITSNAVNADGTRTIWILKDNQPAAVQVKSGATNGTITQIVSGDLTAGDPVITDMVSAQ